MSAQGGAPGFIAGQNAGKPARWLRVMGTACFDGEGVRHVPKRMLKEVLKRNGF